MCLPMAPLVLYTDHPAEPRVFLGFLRSAMNSRIFNAMGLGFILLAVSCASQKPGQVVGKTAAGNDSDMPIAPKDAQFTIYCQGITGPDHLERSRALRQLL